MVKLRRSALVLILALIAGGPISLAAETYYNDFDKAPHNYYDMVLQDPVSKLARRIEAGEFSFPRPKGRELLEDLLAELDIPTSSQVLVYSKTSLQRRNISRENPRALYFNEEVYVGWVPGGFIEIISIDPTHGGVFYVLMPSDESGEPEFVQRNDCMGCHAGSFTEYLPGLMQESRYTTADGRGIGRAEPFWPGHGISFKDRWGGWFVTGEHGLQGHLGNAVASRTSDGIQVDLQAHAVLPNLDGVFDTKLHLGAGKSDILALLLHDHQVGFHNQIMENHYRVRSMLNAVDASSPAAETKELTPEQDKELTAQIEQFLKYTLFTDHPLLDGGIQKTDEAFREVFLSRAILTPEGESLRDLDLSSGGSVFRNRLSYMIYSDAFVELPQRFRHRYFSRMGQILTAADPGEAFHHLGAEEKSRIARIVAATIDDLPAGWPSF